MQLRLALARDPRDLVHVDEVRLRRHLVRGDLVELARDVDLHPVREVAAVRQREAHHRVARVEQRVVDGGVRLGAGVRLHVGVVGAEQRLRAIDRELLDDVDVLAAAVVALAGIALGVLVREDAPLRLEDRGGHEVLAGDHLQRALLAFELTADRLGHLGVDIGKWAGEEIGHSSEGIVYGWRTVAVTGSMSGAPCPVPGARPRGPRSARRGAHGGRPRTPSGGTR